MAIESTQGGLLSRWSRHAAESSGALFRSAAVQTKGTSNQPELDRTGRVNVACMVGLARKGLHVLPAVVLLPYVACAFRQLQRVDALQESMFSSSPLG
jgi:hypothetical protein